jgi:hypothetical protein
MASNNFFIDLIFKELSSTFCRMQSPSTCLFPVVTYLSLATRDKAFWSTVSTVGVVLVTLPPNHAFPSGSETLLQYKAK